MYEELIMKRSCMVLMLAVAFFTACTDKQEGSFHVAESGEQNAPYPTVTVGVSTIDPDNANNFQKASYEGFHRAEKEHPSLKMLLANAGGNQVAQLTQASDLVNQGVQSLVINITDPKITIPMVEDLCNRQIPVVYLSFAPDEKALAKCHIAYNITGDDVQAGILQGLQVLDAWDANAKLDKNGDGVIQYAIIKMVEGGDLTNKRTKWATNTMSHYPQRTHKTEELFSGYAFFDSNLAEQMVEKWMQDPKFSSVEVILGNSDDLALGAVSALAKQGKTLPVFGIDGTLDALRAVKEGKLAGTVTGQYDLLAENSVRIAANLAAKRPILEGLPDSYRVEQKTIRVPFEAVNSNNVDQFLK